MTQKIKGATTMKRITAALLAVTACAAVAMAYWVYSAYIFNGIITTPTNVILNLNTTPNAAGINYLSAQAVYSQAAPAAASFNDGRAATGSFTVSSNVGLSSASAVDQITVAPTSQILAISATDYLIVTSTIGLAGSVVTYNGNPLTEGIQWSVVPTTTGTATNITAAINKFNGVSALRTGSTVNLTALPAGVAGNSKTLSASAGNITVGGAFFAGGANNQLATAYIRAHGVKLMQGSSWQVTDTSSGTATSIASVLNHINGIKANAVGSVVFSTATTYGTAGNAMDLFSSNPTFLTVATGHFTGGQDNAVVSINGVGVTQGANWVVGASAAITAKNIAAALNANSTLIPIVVSSSTNAAIVFTTSTAVGVTSNYTLTSSTPTAIVPSGATMTGGSNAAYTISTPSIFLANNGLSTGYSVVYTTGTGVNIAPLHPNATYYVISQDVNDIELATTSTGAVAGAFITLTSSSTTGPHTFTLTPTNYAGTASFQWLGSNDCVNYNPVSVSSVTYSSPTTSPTSSLWDFQRVNYQCIEFSVIPPTSGGLTMAVKVNGK